MAEARKGRPILKRIAVWTAGVALLLSMYVAGEPIVTGIVLCRFRAAIPVVSLVYEPVNRYRKWQLPGYERLWRYRQWGIDETRSLFSPDSPDVLYKTAPAGPNGN